MTQVTNTVRFVLDGRIVEAQGERRTTTVLDYLREQLHRTGTKEGCAEGDCGACVVMVGELNAAGTGVDYVATNACIQLLPSLDGKSVKTIESLKKPMARCTRCRQKWSSVTARSAAFAPLAS